jgi:hypothetical protein
VSFQSIRVCSIIALLVVVVAPHARADGLQVSGGVGSWATDNVYLDRSKEWDLVIRPSADLDVDFAEIWSSGYSGELNVYTQHGDLLSHWHQLYLFVNPAWGAESENEFTLEASAETLRNQTQYAANNLLKPALLARLVMEPTYWFRWKMSSTIAYEWLYDDRLSSSLDLWVNGEVSFTLPSRSTLSPRAAYGFRYYPNQERAVTSDTQDHQTEVGIHYSQELWKSAGLQLDYAHIFVIGDSGLLLRKLTQTQFSYLDQGFLYSGNIALLGIKQLLGESWSIEVSTRLKEIVFAGWNAVDASGALTGEDRRDIRLTPAAGLSYLWSGQENEKGDAPAQVRVSAEYSFTKQWSNSDWYDTSAHVVALNLSGSL